MNIAPFRKSAEKLVVAWVTKLDLLLGMDVPILMAINQLAQDHDLRELKAVNKNIGSLMQSGWTLAEALEKHTTSFGSLHLYVAAAERKGTVRPALRQIAAACSRLHAMSVPIFVSYNDDGILSHDASDQAADTPTITQADSLFMLLSEGEYSTSTCSLIVERKAFAGHKYPYAVYAVKDGATKNVMNMTWQEGAHLLNRILLMANMNYWDRNQRSGWTCVKMEKAEALFVIAREYGENGQMKVILRRQFTHG